MTMPLFHKDTMSAEERGLANMTKKPVDRCPYSLFALGFSGKTVGYSIFDIYDDPEKGVDSVLKANMVYGAAGLPWAGFPAIGPWEFGGEMQWPLSEFAQTANAEPAVTTREEAWKLKLPTPEELKTLGYVPRHLKFTNIMKSMGSMFGVPLYGVWTTAGNIVGISNLSKWTIKDPDLVHFLMKFTKDFLVMFHKLVVDEYDAKMYIAVNSTASAANNIISPKGFKEFVLPQTIEYHKELIDMGIPGIMFHLCGEQNLNYEYYPEVPLPPLSQISVSHEVDLDKASKTFPDFPLIGNIEPALFQTGTPEQVYESCRVAIEKGKKHKAGFTLAPGCEMPPGAIPYNVWMMAKAVNDFGYYD
jgi:uroporphyrinogen decarboxylase